MSCSASPSVLLFLHVIRRHLLGGLGVRGQDTNKFFCDAHVEIGSYLSAKIEAGSARSLWKMREDGEPPSISF